MPDTPATAATDAWRGRGRPISAATALSFLICSVMRAAMVGDPKHLSDLAQIEADVRIRCRTCGFEEDWTVEALAKHLRDIGGSSVWSEVTRYLRCRKLGCGSPEVRAIPVPYARRQPNLPRRIGELDRRIIDAALGILGAAARKSSEACATPDVLLALLVLHRYARDQEVVRTFWTRAGLAPRTANESLSGALSRLRWRLVQRGWVEPEVVVNTRVHTWTNPAPAPPGWRPMPGYGHEGDDDGPANDRG